MQSPVNEIMCEICLCPHPESIFASEISCSRSNAMEVQNEGLDYSNSNKLDAQHYNWLICTNFVVFFLLAW